MDALAILIVAAILALPFIALLVMAAALVVINGILHQLSFSMAHGGIIGLALYFAGWVFLPVVMLALSAVSGVILAISHQPHAT